MLITKCGVFLWSGNVFKMFEPAIYYIVSIIFKLKFLNQDITDALKANKTAYKDGKKQIARWTLKTHDCSKRRKQHARYLEIRYDLLYCLYYILCRLHLDH
jgi:hypothetical protein